MGIETLEQDAVKEREAVAKKQAADIAKRVAEVEAGRGENAAEATVEILDQCRIRLQSVYSKATRAFKDHLYTVILQTENSIHEIKSIHTKETHVRP